MKHFCSLLLVIVFFLSSGWCEVMAQNVYTSSEPINKQLRIGGYIGGQANISGFRNARLWDARFLVRPYVAWNAGLTIQEPVLPRFYLNAGLSFIQLGLASAYFTSYTAGGRYAAKTTRRSAHGLLSLPLSVQYNFRLRPKVSYYVSIGAIVYYNLEERNGISQSRSIIRDLNTGDVATISEQKNIVNQWIPAITTSIGVERTITRRSAFLLELTGCVGLKEMTNTNVSVSIVNPATLVKPINFTGNVLNKGSFIGVKLGYLYSRRNSLFQ